MRAMLITAAAGLALAGCTMETADKPVVVTDGSNVAVVAPATEPVVVPAGAEAPLPMLGSWTCGSTGFTITPGTYRTAGGSATRIESVERLAANDYRLVLQDAKKIRLTNIIDGKLSWQNETAEGSPQISTCTKKL